jgi:hypothetical protein
VVDFLFVRYAADQWQDIDGGIGIQAIMGHLLLLPVILPIVNLLNAIAMIYTIVAPPKGFHVVEK